MTTRGRYSSTRGRGYDYEYPDYYGMQQQAALGSVPYIERSNIDLFDTLGKSLDADTQRYELANQTMAAAISEYGNIGPLYGEDADVFYNYLSGLDENIRDQVRGKWGGDYGAAYPALIRKLAKEKPLVSQAKYAAEQDFEMRKKAQELKAKNLFINERYVGKDEAGNDIYEPVDPFADPLLSVRDGKLSVSPRDYSSIIEQTNYGQWAGTFLSDKLSKDISESLLRDLGSGYIGNSQIQGYTSQQLDKMAASGRILNDDVVKRFIEETTWGYEHGTDINKARGYLLERLKEQVPHQIRTSVSAPSASSTSGTKGDGFAQTVFEPSTRGYTQEFTTENLPFLNKIFENSTFFDNSGFLKSDEELDSIIENFTKELEQNRDGVGIIFNPDYSALPAGERVYRGSGAKSVIDAFRDVYEVFLPMEERQARRENRNENSFPTKLKESLRTSREIIKSLREEYDGFAGMSDPEVWNHYNLDYKQYDKIMPVVFPIHTSFRPTFNEKLAGLTTNLELSTISSEGTTDLVGKGSDVKKKTGLDESTFRAYIRENPNNYGYDYSRGLIYVDVPEFNGAKVGENNKLDYSSINTSSPLTRVYISNWSTSQHEAYKTYNEIRKNILSSIKHKGEVKISKDNPRLIGAVPVTLGNGQQVLSTLLISYTEPTTPLITRSTTSNPTQYSHRSQMPLIDMLYIMPDGSQFNVKGSLNDLAARLKDVMDGLLLETAYSGQKEFKFR